MYRLAISQSVLAIRHRRIFITYTACVAMILTIPGCQPSDGRMAISGTVMLDGDRMPEGAISFRPMNGTVGPSSGGTIQQGNFTIPAGKGLMPGDYQVGILCMKETGRIIDDPQKGKIQELVAVQFQQPVPNVVIKAGERNVCKFEMHSVPRR